jgi:hypothetical protein
VPFFRALLILFAIAVTSVDAPLIHLSRVGQSISCWPTRF